MLIISANPIFFGLLDVLLVDWILLLNHLLKHQISIFSLEQPFIQLLFLVLNLFLLQLQLCPFPDGVVLLVFQIFLLMLCDFLRINGSMFRFDGHQFLMLLLELRDDDFHSKLFFLFQFQWFFSLEGLDPFLILQSFLFLPFLLFHPLDQLALVVLLQLGLPFLSFHFLLHLLPLLLVHLYFLLHGCLIMYLPLELLLLVLQVFHKIFSLFGPGMIYAIKILLKMLILKRIDLIPQFFFKGLLLKFLP